MGGGGPIIPFVVHWLDSPSIWQPLPSLRRGLSINPGVTRHDVYCVGVCYKGDIVVMDELASTLCKYDLRNGDLFVMSWARV